VSYAFTDNFKLLTEAGTTSRAIDGQATQRLHKLTIAPTLALRRDFWSRPELRFYVTRVAWNEAATVANSATFGAKGRRSSTLMGIQYTWWE
jgi:maltoporin